jgi:hypothetical protein
MMPKLVFFRFIILILSVTCYVPVPWISLKCHKVEEDNISSY